MSWSMLGAGVADGQKKLLLQANLKGTYKWNFRKWEMNTCCVACTTGGEAHQEGVCHPPGVPAGHTATRARSIQCQPWPRAASWSAPGTAPMPPPPHPEPWPPSHATGCHPAPHHTATGLWNCLPALEHNFGFPLGQEPKQICSCVSWRSSNPTTVLSSRKSPQSQYPSRPSSSWAKLLNLSCYWLRSIRLGSRRRGREDLHEILIYILHWLACQK